MLRAPNPNSPEEVRKAIGLLNQNVDETGTAIGTAMDLHESTFDHATYDTAYGWGDHAGLYEPAGDIAIHAAVVDAHHAKYTDAEAISAIQGDASWNATEWDTAYSWDDHSTFGYLDDPTDIGGVDVPLIGTFFNGTFQETFNALVTSDGSIVTMSLEQANGGGDLTMQFSDGYTVLDCTPAATIVLTAGTDAGPTANFVFIPQSTKALTVDTDWPDAVEHIKVGYFLVPSATFVFGHGTYVNQNWNDHPAGVNNQGHLSHIAMKLRHLGATWFSGVGPGGATASYYTISAGNTDWISEAGEIDQVHHHVFAALDTLNSHIVIVKNWFGASYTHVDNLFDITDDSTGTPITNNRYFNLVFWGVANKEGEFSAVMCNLPSGFYVKSSEATADTLRHTDFTIPREFHVDSGTAFLICRSTFKMGATWTHIETEDLRGQHPSGSAGGVGTSDHGSLGGLADDDHAIYLLADGSRELTGDLAVSDGITIDGRDLRLDGQDLDMLILHVGKVKVDTSATSNYLGAVFNDGAFRTSTGITYTDGGNFITLTTNDGEIVHDSLSGYDSDRHVAHSTVFVQAGTGLSIPFGGSIASTFTINLDLNGLAAATIAAADMVPFYDSDLAVEKKTTFANFIAEINHGSLKGLGDDDHNPVYYNTIRLGTWMTNGHESTYDHSLIGSGGVFGDDDALNLGDAPDYWFVYNSTATQFEFWSTDVDGAGADGLVWSVDDGTDDVDFSGEIDIAGGRVTISGAQLLYSGDANGFFASLFWGSGGSNLSHSAGDQGYYNTGLGYTALNSVTSGTANVGCGFASLRDVTTGTSNAAIGSSSLRSLQTGAKNTALGHAPLFNMIGGSLNQGLGYFAGTYLGDGTTPFTAGDYNVYDGPHTKASANGVQREVAIGSYAIGSGSDTVTIGGPSNTDVYLTGVVHASGLVSTVLAAVTAVSGTSVSGYGVFGESTSGRGVYGLSDSNFGVYGESNSQTGVVGLSVSGHGFYATTTSGIGMFAGSDTNYGFDCTAVNHTCAYIHRNTATPSESGSQEVLKVEQGHASDSNPCVTFRQDGTGSILKLYDGATLEVDFKDGGDVDFTSVVKAGGYKSSDGTAGVTDDIAVAKVGGGTRTLHVKNGLITGYTDS